MANFSEHQPPDKYGNVVIPKLGSRFIKYIPQPRQPIEITVENCIKLAKENNRPVKLWLNGVEYIIQPNYEKHLISLIDAAWNYYRNSKPQALEEIMRKS